MASRHYSFKTGKVGAGVKHADYIAGQGKYSEREDVRHLSDHNLPEWAVDGRDFFAAADQYERANGRSYSEVEFAIPRDVADPVQYAREYAAQLLGDRHAYRLAVHDKAAQDGGRNVHGHLMFSERRLDGIARDREQFFKRANAKHPERGGTAKDRLWNDRKHIQALRRGYEAHARAYGVALDLRSNLAQGLGLPEPKIGPQRKRSTPDKHREERAGRVRRIRGARREAVQIEADLVAIEKELAVATRAEAIRITAIQERATRAGRRQAWQAKHLWQPAIAQQAGTPPTPGKPRFWEYSDGPGKGKPCVVDYGDRLKPAGKTISDTKVAALLQVAKAKGWTAISVSGPADFRARVAEAAQAQGLPVLDADLRQHLAAKQKQAEAQARQAMLDRIAAERAAKAKAKEGLQTQAPKAAAQRMQAEAEAVKDAPPAPAPADFTGYIEEERRLAAQVRTLAAALEDGKLKPYDRTPVGIEAEAERNARQEVGLHHWNGNGEGRLELERWHAKKALEAHNATKRPAFFHGDWDKQKEDLSAKVIDLAAQIATRDLKLKRIIDKQVKAITAQHTADEGAKAARRAELAAQLAQAKAALDAHKAKEPPGLKQARAQEAKAQRQAQAKAMAQEKARAPSRSQDRGHGIC